MAIFAPLSIGKQALLAHERAIGVTGHNISNVNTKGFSRQEAVMSATRPDVGGFGTGVALDAVVRSVDGFLEARQLASASALSGAATGRQLLDRLQAYFPVGEDGIGSALAEFFDAANALANSPQDLAARNQLIEAGHALAGQLRTAAAGIETLQREADQRIGQAALDANAALQNLSQLNREIVAGTRAGRETNDLRDKRQEALTQLAGSLSIQVVEGEDGGINVYSASGQGLLIGADPATLATELDPTALGLDGNPLSRIGILSGSGTLVDLAGTIGGRIGALQELRDDTIPDDAAALDLLANTLRTAVNGVQTDPAARDLDNEVGIPFFGGTGAADLQVLIVDARDIAAARGSDLSDNTNARSLANLSQGTFAALGGTTLNGYFGIIHARIGQEARSAEDATVVEENVAASLSAQREAVSGVSLDEEFTNLIRFQRGFQAAAQLINVSNTLLDDLLGIVS